MSSLLERIEEGIELVRVEMELHEAATDEEPPAFHLATIGLLRSCEAALSQQDAAQQQMQKLIHLGYTNPYQIDYAKEDSGSFYPDTENDCYIPVYMLKIHEHRLGHDYTTHPQPQKVESFTGEWSVVDRGGEGVSDIDLSGRTVALSVGNKFAKIIVDKMNAP